MLDESDMKPDAHDPVNARLDAKDGRPNMEEAFGQAKPQEPTAVDPVEHHAMPEDAAHDPDLNDFAANVMAGLNEAGMDVDLDRHQAETERMLERNAQQNDPAGNLTSEATEFEAYFSGWNGPEEIEAEPGLALVQDNPPPPHLAEAPAEPAFAAGPEIPSPAIAPAQDDYDANEKHDALADAVQAALLSVYGGQTSNAAASASQDPQTGNASDTDDAFKHSSADDGLSPQDVILNYFDYQIDAPSLSRETVAHPFGDNRQIDENLAASARRAANAAQPSQAEAVFRPAPQDVRFSNAPATATLQTAQRYDGPPSFPPPATIETAKDRAIAANRDSGRLLGAAGIGLIGGIAIAATLAVFFINSYGPTTPPGAKSSGVAAGQGREGVNRGPAVDVAGTAAVSNNVIASDVSGMPGQPISLAIAVQSSRPAEQTLVSITRVPDGVRLSAGVDAGGGNWLLPPKRLNGLTLIAQADRAESFALEAQLLDSNARSPLSEKKQFAVALEKPVAAAPDTPKPATLTSPGDAPAQTAVAAWPAIREQNAAAAASLPAFSTQTIPTPALQTPKGPETAAPSRDQALPGAVVVAPEKSTQNANLAIPPLASAPPPASATEVAELEDLIREGNKRMRDGDIVQARSLYAKAVVSGDADAALAMGRSFDPIYFERLDRKNAEPDAARAFEWYKQAMDRGATQTAKMRIDNLKQYLNK